MAPLDYEAAAQILDDSFNRSQKVLESESPSSLQSSGIQLKIDRVFESSTLAFRETLLGCVVAKLVDHSIDVRLPYINQGGAAFNGRTLDEKVINPLLQGKQIPSSKGPYLSVFRRNVTFHRETRKGIRDKEGYDAFEQILAWIQSSSNDNEELEKLLDNLTLHFLQVRDRSRIKVARPRSVRLPQLMKLIDALLQQPSGGRIPVFLSLSIFEMLNRLYELEWHIEVQGINESDKAGGAGGDITIKKGAEIILAIEITERTVELSRVQATFRSKISPLGIRDYLFIVTLARVDPEALRQAESYFSQGHEVNFADLRQWLWNLLITAGGKGRTIFLDRFTEHLEGPGMPSQIKVFWNDAVTALANA